MEAPMGPHEVPMGTPWDPQGPHGAHGAPRDKFHIPVYRPFEFFTQNFVFFMNFGDFLPLKKLS